MTLIAFNRRVLKEHIEDVLDRFTEQSKENPLKAKHNATRTLIRTVDDAVKRHDQERDYREDTEDPGNT